MCAIVDNNVRDQVFGEDNNSPAGRLFLDWLSNGQGKLVVGGDLLRELDEYGDFNRWLRTALARNNALAIDDAVVDDETQDLRRQGRCRSDDEHVIALARISGARLLFTNDADLQTDFKDRNLINNPRGVIYTTRRRQDVTRTHRNLLRRTDLCAA